MDSSLETAFTTTRYCIAHEGDRCVIRIGEPTPARLAGWVRRYAGSGRAWLITACNPGAAILDTDRNRGRTEFLRHWVATRATAWLSSVNEAADGRWPDEPGVLAAGIEEGLMRALARRLGQLAIVQVPATAPVSLLWLHEAPA